MGLDYLRISEHLGKWLADRLRPVVHGVRRIAKELDAALDPNDDGCKSTSNMQQNAFEIFFLVPI
jgi:hypothetical protein